jgi:TIR domain
MTDSVAARETSIVGGFARRPAELPQFWYAISPLKSRVLQGFEPLSVIAFQFQRIQQNQRLRAAARPSIRHLAAAMTELKYRAFLSYSHRDTAWAKWLHRALEAYRIDKDLVGRETAHGPVPKALRPIFRDREDFSAGHSLNEQTVAALEASQFLVAICSPNAARSQYVNEEIRHFKARGGAARVIPLIVDGEPGDGQRECFPPAIRYRLGADGNLTDDHEEPIAADARPQGDGKEIAKKKIVAGLLGLPLDQIMRRAERARRRRNLFRAGAAAAAAVVVAIGYLGWSRAIGVSSRLYSAQTISIETDGAALCQRTLADAESQNASESKRIALATKCVHVLSYNIVNLEQDSRVPRSFIWSFEADVAILQKFADAGKLTPEQSGVLATGKATIAQLKQLCEGTQSDGTNEETVNFRC